jgi:kinesin family protein 5
VEVFKRAVALAPDEGHEKYMYLSQLLEGSEEALGCSRKGIDVLRRAIQKETEDPLTREDLKVQLCQAICSHVETMLNSTSAANLEGPLAKEAISLLTEAEQQNPKSPEPPQVLASLYVELDKADLALPALRKSLALWHKPLDEKAHNNNNNSEMDIDEEDEDGDDASNLNLPSFEFRFETAKLIMELEEDASEAIHILDELLAEDDASLDVWFLMTLCHQGMGQWEDALGCLDHIEQALSKFPEDSPKKQNLRTLTEDVQRQKKEWEEEEKKLAASS